MPKDRQKKICSPIFVIIMLPCSIERCFNKQLLILCPSKYGSYYVIMIVTPGAEFGEDTYVPV